ncbi:thiopurine S-methyltransferase-like isoform X1, partial [Leptotrombidium deliense]
SKYANTVECVWDRASIYALDDEDQKIYVSQIRKMLKPKFSYLLQTLTYDETKMKAPPFCVTREKVEEHFGKFCKIHQFENESVETLAFGQPSTFHAFHLSNK